MSIKPKERTGNDQVQVLVYIDTAELQEFDAYVGKGNRSKYFRNFVRQYNRAKRFLAREERGQ